MLTNYIPRIHFTLPFAIVLIAVFAVLISPLSVSAQSGSIGGRPAKPDSSNDRTKSIFIHTITPGSTVEDAVEVINNSNETQVATVYVTDSAQSTGGAFACAQAIDTPISVGKWVKVSQQEVSVAANSSKTVPFTISAPANAEPGEHNGCIVIQVRKDQAFQGGVSLNFRTAIRVAITIPGNIKKELTLVNPTVLHQAGKVVVHPSIKNTGTVSIDIDIITSIHSLFGTTIQQQKSTYPVLRDQMSEWNFEFESPFWGGVYFAKYTASYDQDTQLDRQLKAEDIVTKQSEPVVFFSVPHPLALLIYLAGVAIIVAAILYLRRYRSQKFAVNNHWIKHAVTEEDNLALLAKRTHIDWKIIARANKIKAPYALTPGQVVLLPPKKPALKKSSAAKK